MSSHRFSRRTMLRGLLAGGAAVSIGLPALDVFLNDHGTALASGDPLPRRFGMFFWGNGILPARWNPAKTGAGSEWELSDQLAPLAEVKEHVTVVSGLKVYTGNTDPHGSGPVGLLSGAPFPETDHSTFAGPSLDQIIAAAVGGSTRFRSLEVGAQTNVTSLSYNGPHNVNPAESSPLAFFQRVFVDGFVMPGTTAEPDPRVGLRRSVLDAVTRDAKDLQGVLGSVDRARLEQHLDGVRALEKSLQKLEENPPSLAACALPGEPLAEYPDIEGRPQLSAISRAMCDILAMALACDQTRVFSHWFSSPVNNLLFPGAPMGHHQLTHDEPGEQPQVFAILLQILAEYAYLVSALAAVPEGDRTLLDRCAILGTTDCSYAKAHSVEDYPILIAGSCGGALKPGIHYRSVANENTSKVGLTLARAMGLPLAEFGKDAGNVTSSLTAIEA